MANKFPKPSVFTEEKISATRHAIYENGNYICQLNKRELSSWLFNARRSTVKFCEDEACITVTRIVNALEYIASRKLRVSSSEIQMDLF